MYSWNAFHLPHQAFSRLESAGMTEHMAQHGDAVKDVAFAVDDLEGIVQKAKEMGGQIVRDIWEETDQDGTVRFAIVQTVSSRNGITGIHIVANWNSARSKNLIHFHSMVTRRTRLLNEETTGNLPSGLPCVSYR